MVEMGFIKHAGAAAMLTAAALAGVAPAHADVKAGVDAWDRGEYKKAVEEWRRDAIAGDADAQFNLGQAYKLGRGVPVDLALAEQWYGKAAIQGHPRGEDSYGLALFQNGKHDEAVPWLEKAVARGEPRAQLVLGTMLFNGDGVKKDWVRAYALLTRSSAAGLPQGSQTLAQMDQYIPSDVRQQGIALARQYEAQADRPGYVPEVAGAASPSSLRGTELPASTYASDSDSRPTLAPVAQTPATTKPGKRPKPRLADPEMAEATPPADEQAPPPVAARPAAGRGWTVQFGAFGVPGNARALWQQLASRVGALEGYQPIYGRQGSLTSLRTGPVASSGDASRLCAAVKASVPGTPCVVVAP